MGATRETIGVGVLSLLLTLGGHAQDAQNARPAHDASRDPMQALQHGRLVVWVVRPGPAHIKDAPSPNLPAFKAPEPGYHEATPSTLGQSASTFGQSAGSYGVDSNSQTISAPPSGQVRNAAGGVQTLAPGYGEQTASTLGQTSSSYGTTAGNYGQTSSSLRTSAAAGGTDSSNVGQTSGSFGNSLSTLPVAGQPGASVSRPLGGVVPGLAAAYPELTTQISYMDADQLKHTLAAAAVTHSFPDLLLFVGFGPNWPGPPQDVIALEAAHLQNSPAERVIAGEETRGSADFLLLKVAPHLPTGRALLLYLDQHGGRVPQR